LQRRKEYEHENENEDVITLDDLRRFAVAHSLCTPTTLKRALHRLGFVQADPIRAPARAQDLILRHRVKDYRAGDLERRYVQLGVEEDFFVTYGFVTRSFKRLYIRARIAVSLPRTSSWPGPLSAGSGHSSCWSSYANAVQCIRARSMTISRMVR
jgi:uncharacterized protein YcaQ